MTGFFVTSRTARVTAVCAEGGSAAVDVGAGDIYLQPAHLLFAVQLAADLSVFLYGKAADVGHHRLVKDLPQTGQLLPDDGLHTGVLQPHGVQQAPGVFSDAGGGVSVPGGERRPLEGEGAQTVDVVDPGKFIPVAEGTAGGDDGVLQRQTAEGDGGIYHTISSLRRTGPSLQMRLWPYLVRQVQPMQAPKPQPMRSSKLNCPSVRQRCHTAWSMASGPQV